MCDGDWLGFTGKAELLAADAIAVWSVATAVISFCERFLENSANERVNGNGFLISCECKCRWNSFSC